MHREAFLAKADQDLASTKEAIEQLVTDYTDNVSRKDNGDDEVDVIVSLIHFLLSEPVEAEVRPGEVRVSRAQFLASYLAVAVKMIHDARHQ